MPDRSDPRVPSVFEPPGADKAIVQAGDSVEQRAQVPTSPVVNIVMFVLTVLTVFHVGAQWAVSEPIDLSWTALLRGTASWKIVLQGWIFAVPLLSILLAHEFGHYIAARIHRVPASLPFFIPMPVPPFGTMGAVIRMRGRIASRKVLLDVGAAGPIAGMVVAVPVLIWGLLHSDVHAVSGSGIQEGQCLLYWLIKRLIFGVIPEGSDVFLHPVALAGWAGLFVTMINLLPVGQLDGGHIAHALFGRAHDRIAKWVHAALPLLVAFNVLMNLLPHIKTGRWSENLGQTIGNSAFWLVWFVLLSVIGRVHPPTDPGKLGAVRTAIAIGTLILFVLLFMPTPMATY
ncbi:MAG: site-2 protease family protein [Deltaproteobacteria bacterium]|nr:site-2 protease family protein [Deltaproteobacteria bacterium]